MGIIRTNKLGKSNVEVTQLGLGCAPIGDILDVISEEQAQNTLQAAWDSGVRYFDTSPFYGYGKSEHRLGTFLRNQPRDEFIISTKVGRILNAPRDPKHFDNRFYTGGRPGRWIGGLPFVHRFDYSYDGIMRSYEDSLQRLSLPSVDLLVIHDLDHVFNPSDAAVSAYLSQLFTSGWRALEELRFSGQIKGIGAGINELAMIPRLLDLVDIDFILVSYAYTLLDQELLREDFSQLTERNVGVVVGAAFATGILATGAVEGARYIYGPAPEPIMEKVRRIETVCKRHNVPLPAAALQFPLGHPLVPAVIPGALAPEHVQSNAQVIQHPIPSDFWAELKSENLIPHNAPTP